MTTRPPGGLYPAQRLVATLCVLAMGGWSAARAAEAAGDDWSGTLNGAEAAASSDTGVIGLAAEDLAMLVESRGEAADSDPEPAADFVRNRRRFVMREIKFNSDWDTDPTSLPAFIDQLKRRTGFDAQALKPRKPLTFDDPEVTDWPFVFMTAHNAFTFSDAEGAGLARYIRQGGFLHSDDCLYGFPFGPAFHREIEKVFPGQTLEPFTIEHPAYGPLLEQKYTWGLKSESGLPISISANPFEAMAMDGHLAVLYTPPDLGCHWEISTPPTPSNPLGTGMHGLDRKVTAREDSYRMGINIVFYAMTH